MNGLEFTDEAARLLEKIYLTRDVRAYWRLFGNSIWLVARVFWISDVVRDFCAKAWGDRRSSWCCRWHRYLDRSNSPLQSAKRFNVAFI